jgi:SAM-dependent methyltransferase
MEELRVMAADAEVYHDPYQLLPELYDLEHEDFADDLGLYLQLAEVVGDPILELGSGTGRVLVPLARAGYRVTGLDQSAAMHARARLALKDTGLADRITLHQDEMSAADAAPGGPFGLALFTLNGFMHLATQDEQRRALTAVRQALDPRGMVVVDIMNPMPELLAGFDGRVRHEGSWKQPDGTHVTRYAARTHHHTEQLIQTQLWYDLAAEDGALRRISTAFPMRYAHRSELELMLELAGFVEWRIYGSYDLDPHDDASDRLIAMAEVTSSERG